MTDTKPKAPAKDDLVLEYELDAAPEKVWRAVSSPALREKWLPREELADGEPIVTAPGEEVRYRMREDAPPFLESIVTFQVRPNTEGGTILRIVHGLVDVRPAQPANSNTPWLMRAA